MTIILSLSTRWVLRASSRIAVLALGILVVLGQGDHSAMASDVHHHHVYAQLAKAPEKMRHATNPFAEDRNAPAAGKKLFERHCAECHGVAAQGSTRAPSLRARAVQQAPPGTIFWILTNGVVRRGMPVWSKLPEAQRWQLVTYIKSLGNQQAPIVQNTVRHSLATDAR